MNQNTNFVRDAKQGRNFSAIERIPATKIQPSPRSIIGTKRANAGEPEALDSAETQKTEI